MTMGTLDKLREIQQIITNDEIRHDILTKYGLLSDAMTSGTIKDTLRRNKDTYRIILCDTIINWLKMEKSAGSPFIVQYIQRYPSLASLIDNSDKVVGLLNNFDVQVNKMETFEDIQNGLRCFGLENIESIDDDELSLSLDEELGDISFDDLFDDEDLNIDDTEITNSDFDETSDEEVEEEGTVEESEETFDLDDTELENIRKTWESKIDNVVKSIMATYSSLYESGYGLVSPSGILTNNGIIKTDTQGRMSFTGDKPIDIEIFNAIQAVTNNKFSTFARPEAEINIHDIMRNPNIITYTGQHLRFMFGHIRFCTKTNSLKKYLTKNKILLPSEVKTKSESELKGYKTNESETKIIKYSTMRGWIKETLEDIFLKAYRDVGIGTDITPETIALSNEVNMVLSRTLKNVIVVAERKKGVNTRLRISADEGIVPTRIINALQESLNVGNSNLIKVIQIGEISNGVLDINVVYNDKSYSQDSLFAHQVLDILEEQDIIPSWDNVILGKKDDGTIMTYNFKDTKNPIYGLYAGTRSGKGVMTLNLLASALADNCKVIYVDGKPEMAVALSDIAWKKGLDACVFNGLEVNQNYGLENRGNSIRQHNRFASLEHIPENIFRTEDELNMFMLTAHYLRGMELVIRMAKERMDKCSPSDWMVAVFDECEQFASQEETINKIMDKAYERRKKAIDPNDPKGTRKINITKDPAAIFIDDFRMWRERIESDFTTCVKSAFGKGNITVFFVWQSSKFPNIYKNTSSLAAMVESSRAKMIKIIGKGAVEQGGSNDFGNATTLKDMKWYDNRFSGQAGGFFAIGGNIKDGMKVFRPFNIYSDANGKELILMNAAAAGIAKEDLIGSQFDEDFNVIPEVGFEGYTDRLLGRMGLSAAQQLNIGFNYANESVVKYGMGRSLLDFIYNAHEFSGERLDTEDMEGLDFSSIIEEGEGVGAFDNIQDEDDDYLDFGLEGINIADNLAEKFKEQKAEKINKSSTFSRELREQQKVAQHSNSINSDVNRFEDAVSDSEETIEINGKTFTKEDIESLANAFNLPINETITYQAGGKTGRQNYINQVSNNSEIIGLTTKNSIVASMDEYETAERFGKTFFKGLWGSRWEFQKRWEAIINSITKSIKADMVTRITLTGDNIFVNNRQVVTINILGGDADVRIEDIVEFYTLCKKFPQLKNIALDSAIAQRLNELYPDDPNGTLFKMSKSLLTIIYLGDSWGEDGIQITRANYMQGIKDKKMRDKEEEYALKSQINAMAAANNPRFKEKSPGYQSRVWESTKKFQGEAWGAIGKNITGKNPSLFKAATVGVAAILALGVGGVLSGTGKILSLFKR